MTARKEVMVRKYKPEDFHQIETWLKDRSMKVFHPRILPENGYIVDEVCALFLYKTDSDISYIENLITNPHSEQEYRNLCINAVIEACFSRATELGYKFVMGVTDNFQVVKRAIYHEAQVEKDKYLLTKQLK